MCNGSRNFFNKLKKKVLIANPLPPPPLNVTAIMKILFYAASLREDKLKKRGGDPLNTKQKTIDENKIFSIRLNLFIGFTF